MLTVPLDAIVLILASSGTSAEAIPEALRTLCLASGWSFGVLWTFDPGAGALRCAALWAEERLRDSEFAEAIRRLSLLPGIGTPGRAWATRQPCWITDAIVDAVVTRNEDACHAGLHGELAFPICIRGEPLGVLEFFSERTEPQNENDLAVLIPVSTLLGLHLRLVHLEEAVDHGNACKAAIVDSAEDAIISASLDGAIQSWNPAAERIFGYSAEEAIGLSIAIPRWPMFAPCTSWRTVP